MLDLDGGPTALSRRLKNSTHRTTIDGRKSAIGAKAYWAQVKSVCCGRASEPLSLCFVVVLPTNEEGGAESWSSHPLVLPILARIRSSTHHQTTAFSQSTERASGLRFERRKQREETRERDGGLQPTDRPSPFPSSSSSWQRASSRLQTSDSFVSAFLTAAAGGWFTGLLLLNGSKTTQLRKQTSSAALLVRFAFTFATSCRWFACGWWPVADDGAFVRSLSAVVCARYLLLRASNQSLQTPSQTTVQPNQLPAAVVDLRVWLCSA